MIVVAGIMFHWDGTTMEKGLRLGPTRWTSLMMGTHIILCLPNLVDRVDVIGKRCSFK